AQYPRPMAIDDAGWVYVGIGQNLAQVVGFNPATGEKIAYVPQQSRIRGQGNVRMGVDGHVYATAEGWGGWYRLYAGVATKVASPAASASDPPLNFPDGTRVTDLNVANRVMTVHDKDGTTRQVNFTY